MIPKKNRLPTLQFEEVVKNGKRADSFLFSLSFKADSSQPPQISVVVSKKVAAKATKRNQLRRRIYSIIREFSLVPGQSIVFVKKGAANSPHSQLVQDLENLLLKCGRIAK